MNSFIFSEQKTIDLIHPESSIIDSCKNEKIITEFNNLICLGQYELAQPFLQQIINFVPTYAEYFYKFIFLRGIPSKWLLTNQLRTSSHYLWILYHDYYNSFKLISNCPNIQFKDYLIDSIEFDILISDAFYNAWNFIPNCRLHLNFLFDLRNIFNFFQSQHLKVSYYLPELRLLSPNQKEPQLYLSLKEYEYDHLNLKINFKYSESFFENIRKIALTQPLLATTIIDKIIINFQSYESRKEAIPLWENIHVIYGSFIMLFLYFRDYLKCYEYIRLLPFDEDIQLCNQYIMMLFGVVVMIYSKQEKKEKETPKEIWEFVIFCLEELGFQQDNQHLSSFKILPYFSSSLTPNYHFNTIENERRILEINCSRCNNKCLLRNKVYEALLGNKNRVLISKLTIINDLYAKFQNMNLEIPFFFPDYINNRCNEKYYQSLSYEQMKSLLSQSSFINEYIALEHQWINASKTIFWNEYLNFLRIGNNHCLGYALQEAIVFVEKGLFNTAVSFLHPINNLKLLLIILVWNKFDNNIEARRFLLNVFWDSYFKLNNDTFNDSNYVFISLLNDIIINLDYFINFSFCIQKKSALNANEIYSQLTYHSIPFVIKPYLLVFDYKTIHSTFENYVPKGNKILQNIHSHSSMIVYSFYIYHFVFKAIEEDYLSHLDENHLTEHLLKDSYITEILLMLNKILIFPYRLNILVDIFSLVLIPMMDYFESKTKDNSEYFTHQTKHNMPKSYNKRVFIQVINLLQCAIKPFGIFNEKNDIKKVFDKKHNDPSLYSLIDSIVNQSQFFTNLAILDTDFLSQKQKDANAYLLYEEFLITKYHKLNSNILEIIFRFNIINNPWLNIINEDISFLVKLCQNTTYYLQIAKKFHMFDVCQKILSFFNLTSSQINLNEIKAIESFCLFKQYAENNANSSTLTKDIIEKLTQFPIDSFGRFKHLFDLSFSDNITTDNSIELLDKSIEYLDKFETSDVSLFKSLIEKYKTLIDPSIIKSTDNLGKIVVSTKNIGVVQISSTTDKLKLHISFLKTQEKAIQTLYEKVTTVNAIDIPYEELKAYFKSAYENISEYEQYTKKTEEETIRNTHNYLKLFLKYLIMFGDTYHNAKKPNNNTKISNTNYLKILQKSPREIIAKLFLKYHNEDKAIEMSSMTKTNIISVIIEYTKRYKYIVINFNEFNSWYNASINDIVNNKNKKNCNLPLNNLIEKENWIHNSVKPFPISMTILEYIYSMNNHFYVPYFISLFRIDVDSLTLKSQVIFWELLIQKYATSKVFNQYLKQIFCKYYLSQIVFNTNEEVINQLRTLSQLLNEKTKMSKTKANSYSRLSEKVNANYPERLMSQKYSFMNKTSNEYINKLQGKLSNYLKTIEQNRIQSDKYRLKLFEHNSNSFLLTTSSYYVGKPPSQPQHPSHFHNITNISYIKSSEYYEKICYKLINQQKFDAALDLAESQLDNNVKSKVIETIIEECLIKHQFTEEELFSLFIRIQNKDIIFKKQNLFKWKPETTLSLIDLLQLNITADLASLHSQLNIFNEILKKGLLPQYNLETLYNTCETDLLSIIRQLMVSQSHSLCYELLKIYGQYDIFKSIVQLSELKLLLSDNNINNKLLALYKLAEVEQKDQIQFCLKLIEEIVDYQNKLLVINYVISHYQKEIQKEILLQLQNERMVISIFFLIPSVIQTELKKKIYHPEKIIESLLINKYFDVIADIFLNYPQIKCDNILVHYAVKAINIKSIISNEENSIPMISDAIMSNQNDIIITEDNIKEIRNSFCYNSSPDLVLFKQILDLCSDLTLIASTCFNISNDFSKLLNSNASTQNKLLCVKLINHLLEYLNKRVISNSNQIHYAADTEIVKKIIIYKKYTTFFTKFIFQGIDSFVILELENAYNNLLYQIEIRNQLIKKDFITIAQQYCKELNIDSRPVVYDLSLFCIKNRNFNKARRLYSKILKEKSNTIFQLRYSSLHLSNEECTQVIDHINYILNGNFNLTIIELDKLQNDLRFKIEWILRHNEKNHLQNYPCLFSFKSFKQSLFKDSLINSFSQLASPINSIATNAYIDKIINDIINESLFYVKTYGTTKQLLNFFVDNDMLPQAFEYLSDQKFPNEVFVDEIIRKCYYENKMESLHFSLKNSIDKINNNKANDVVKQIVSFLKAENAHEYLIKLYELLEMNFEAMFESLEIIKTIDDSEIVKQYYIKGKRNLDIFLSKNKNAYFQIYESGNTNVISNSKMIDRKSLLRMQKLLKFQIEVLKIKTDIKYTLITDKEEDMYNICQEIIIYNSSLVLELVKEFGLLLNKIIMNATFQMIQHKELNAFEQLLQIIMKWNTEGMISTVKENDNLLWNDILTLAISQLPIDNEENIVYIKENIIPRLTDDFLRMQSLFLIGEYFNAAILAVQLNNKGIINEIKTIAINNNLTKLLNFINDINY